MAEQQVSDQLSSEQLFLPHHIKIMKVALALTILRQKPDGVSAREFTERLSLQFGQLQTNWKSRAEQLERELLRTRQDLVKFQVNSEISTTNPFPRDPLSACPPPTAADFSFNPLHSNLNPLCSQPSRFPLSQIQIFSQHSQIFESSSSQDSEIEWQSSGYSSSFSVQKENHSKTLSTLTSSELGRAKYDTAMVERAKSDEIGGCDWITDDEVEERTGDDDESKEEGVLQDRITAHIQFCTSITSLVSARHHLSTLVATDLRETLHDTILDAMRALTESLDSSNNHLTSSLPLSKKVLNEAMTSLVESIQNPLMSLFKEEMSAASVTLVKTIIYKALQAATSMETIETLDSMAVKLCAIPGVCHCAVEELIQQVINSAKILTDALSDCTHLSADCIDAAGVQFKLLESLLTSYHISTIISDDKRQKIIRNLEKSILELSEAFPLFLYSVWKLIAYLS